MSVRVYFMASYAPEGVKGIIGGTDRIAAVQRQPSQAHEWDQAHLGWL